MENKERILESLYILYDESISLGLEKEIDLLNKIEEIKPMFNITDEEFMAYIDSKEGEFI